MTFMIAYVRSAGGGALAQGAFWCLIGASALVSPWLWRGAAVARRQRRRHRHPDRHHHDRRGAAALQRDVDHTGVVGAGVRRWRSSPWSSATTAFVRFNYPAEAWPKAIAAVTIAFSIGQTLGPIATGALSDAFGSLDYALDLSALTLALGAAACAAQRRLAVS